jgi:hypothetical protein
MTYFQDLDAWLTAVLLADEDKDEEAWFTRVKKELKDKILESYRNGQKAGLAPKAPYKKSYQSKTESPREDADRPKRPFYRGR